MEKTPSPIRRTLKRIFVALVLCVAAMFLQGALALLIPPGNFVAWLIAGRRADSGKAVPRRKLFKLFEACVAAVEMTLLQIPAGGAFMLGALVAFCTGNFLVFAGMAAVFFLGAKAAAAALRNHAVNAGPIPVAYVLSAAAMWAVMIPLDSHFAFRFALVLMAALQSAVVAALTMLNAYKLRGEGRFGMGEHARSVALAAGVWLFLFVALTRLSALGGFARVPGDEQYELLPSRRAQINSLGFRGPEIVDKKGPGGRRAFRIVTMGDSATYGWLLTDEKTYSRLLESKLRRAGYAVEVINAGVPAYNLRRISARFRRKVAPLRPDAVVLLTAANDVGDMAAGRFGARLETFADDVKKSGAKLALCTYPFGDAKMRRDPRNVVIMDFARHEGIPLVDLNRALLGKVWMFFPDGHPGGRGNEAMADELFRFFQKSRWLQTPKKPELPQHTGNF